MNELNYSSQYEMVCDNQILMVTSELSGEDLKQILAGIPAYLNQEFVTRDNIQLARWGVNDKFPQFADNLIYNDPDIPVIIQNKVNFLLGANITPYIGKDPVYSTEVTTWFSRNKRWLNKLMHRSAKNYECYGNYWIETIFNPLGQVASMRAIDAHKIRAVMMEPDELEVSQYAVRTTPLDSHEEKYAIVPSINQFDLKNNGFKYIIHGRDECPGQDYYSAPVWIGATKKIQIQSKSFEAITYAFENAWNIKYILHVNEKYYSGLSDTEKQVKKAALKEELNRVLIGTANVGKTIVSETISNFEFKQQDMIRLEPINSETFNEAFVKLIERIGNTQARHFNIDPELSGIMNEQNMSSGSEIRNKYNLHVALKTPVPRSILLEPLEVIKKSYKWDERIEFKFEDFQIATTDAVPSGIQKITSK